MIFESCHVSWAWYWYNVVLKNFLFLAKLARDKMSQRLKLIFKCFSKIKTHAHTYTRTSKAKYWWKAVKLLKMWWVTPHSSFQLPGCLKQLPQNLGKQYHHSLLCQKWLLQNKFGLWEGLRLASFWQRFLLKLSFPESVHPHGGHLNGWLPSQPWPYVSKVLRRLSQGSSEETGHPPNPWWS